MADNQQSTGGVNKFEESLHFPEEITIDHGSDSPMEHQAAADLIRQRVAAAYQNEPDVASETLMAAEMSPSQQLSKHQQFVYELTSQGHAPHDINTAWHEYYAGLTDNEKHEVWREFNEAHVQASRLLKAVNSEPLNARTEPPEPVRHPKRQPSAAQKTVVKHSKQLAAKAVAKIPERHRRPLKSLAFGLSIGCLVLIVFMFTFFNERFIAPFIQPSRSLAGTQVITANAPVSTKPEIIIPKINAQLPVIYWVKSTDEKAVQDGLDNGVVHYGDTAQPGQNGNVVIIGHSASNIFNSGRYKFAFSLLRRVDIGDTFYLQKAGVRYTYQIYKRKIVQPTDVSVLGPADKPAVATLITCDPPGTSTNRLVVVGKQISPNPSHNRPLSKDKTASVKTKVLPSNAPSLWSRIISWFTG